MLSAVAARLLKFATCMEGSFLVFNAWKVSVDVSHNTLGHRERELSFSISYADPFVVFYRFYSTYMF